MIRQNSTGFELGGRFIDERFSPIDGSSSTGWRRGRTWKSPQDRLFEAMNWAVRAGAGGGLEERQAICILAWLAHDETAHLLQNILCDLQLIPWKPVDGGAVDLGQGSESLWGSREALALDSLHQDLVRAAREAAADLDN